MLEIDEIAKSNKYQLACDCSTCMWVLTSDITGWKFGFNKLKEVKEFMKTEKYRLHGYDSERSFYLATMDERFSD